MAEVSAGAGEGLGVGAEAAEAVGAEAKGGERPWFAAEDDKPWYVQQH